MCHCAVDLIKCTVNLLARELIREIIAYYSANPITLMEQLKGLIIYLLKHKHLFCIFVFASPTSCFARSTLRMRNSNLRYRDLV